MEVTPFNAKLVSQNHTANWCKGNGTNSGYQYGTPKMAVNLRSSPPIRPEPSFKQGVLSSDMFPAKGQPKTVAGPQPYLELSAGPE